MVKAASLAPPHMQRPDEASQVQALAVVVEKAGADGFEAMGFAASPKNRYLENVCRFGLKVAAGRRGVRRFGQNGRRSL